MKVNKYHTVGTVPKSNRQIVETEARSITLTHINNRLFVWLGTGIAIKSSRSKLVVLAQTSPHIYGHASDSNKNKLLKLR
jgi:hypothetical protein